MAEPLYLDQFPINSLSFISVLPSLIFIAPPLCKEALFNSVLLDRVLLPPESTMPRPLVITNPSILIPLDKLPMCEMIAFTESLAPQRTDLYNLALGAKAPFEGKPPISERLSLTTLVIWLGSK